jgi:Tat protein secretion system quality control protein TatD with DNase activity
MFISQKPDRVWNGQLIPKWLFGKILISFNGLISEQPRQTEDYLIKEIPPYRLLVDWNKEQNHNSDLTRKNLDC